MTRNLVGQYRVVVQESGRDRVLPSRHRPAGPASGRRAAAKQPFEPASDVDGADDSPREGVAPSGGRRVGFGGPHRGLGMDTGPGPWAVGVPLDSRGQGQPLSPARSQPAQAHLTQFQPTRVQPAAPPRPEQSPPVRPSGQRGRRAAPVPEGVETDRPTFGGGKRARLVPSSPAEPPTVAGPGPSGPSTTEEEGWGPRRARHVGPPPSEPAEETPSRDLPHPESRNDGPRAPSYDAPISHDDPTPSQPHRARHARSATWDELDPSRPGPDATVGSDASVSRHLSSPWTPFEPGTHLGSASPANAEHPRWTQPPERPDLTSFDSSGPDPSSGPDSSGFDSPDSSSGFGSSGTPRAGRRRRDVPPDSDPSVVWSPRGGAYDTSPSEQAEPSTEYPDATHPGTAYPDSEGSSEPSGDQPWSGWGSHTDDLTWSGAGVTHETDLGDGPSSGPSVGVGRSEAGTDGLGDDFLGWSGADPSDLLADLPDVPTGRDEVGVDKQDPPTDDSFGPFEPPPATSGPGWSGGATSRLDPAGPAQTASRFDVSSWHVGGGSGVSTTGPADPDRTDPWTPRQPAQPAARAGRHAWTADHPHPGADEWSSDLGPGDLDRGDSDLGGVEPGGHPADFAAADFPPGHRVDPGTRTDRLGTDGPHGRRRRDLPDDYPEYLRPRGHRLMDAKDTEPTERSGRRAPGPTATHDTRASAGTTAAATTSTRRHAEDAADLAASSAREGDRVARRRDRRTTPRRERGLPSWAAVLVAIGSGLATTFLDLLITGRVGVLFSLGFVLTTFGVAAGVRRSDLFTAGVLPPLAALGTFAVVAAVAPERLGGTSSPLLAILVGLASKSWTLVAASALALGTIAFRVIVRRGEDDLNETGPPAGPSAARAARRRSGARSPSGLPRAPGSHAPGGTRGRPRRARPARRRRS